jgi:hypothetical protein
MFRGQVADVSNREDVELLYAIVDEDTGDEADLTSAAIFVEVQDQNGCVIWDGSIADGDVTLSESTVMRILIPRISMMSFCAGAYVVGMTVTNGGLTKQAIVGSLSVVDGAVPK